MEALARSLYGALLWSLTPAYLLKLWRRGGREPAYRERLGERLGRYEYPAPPPRRLVWVHAVSLGETRAAAPLIAALRAQRPDLRLLLTTSTATGWAAGHALLRAGDVHTWLPYDTPGAVRRFLRHHRPLLGVLMETEVWPNLLAVAAREQLPMVLANARLSAKSLRKGERFATLMRPAAGRFLRVLAQTQDDAQRFREMGAPFVEVCGNLKFDIAPSPALLQRGQQWRSRLQRPVVLAASTRENEEAPLLAAWRELPQPRPLLVLVPRHPQRFDEVAALVEQAGFSGVRRSSWGEGEPPQEAALADVWLGDSIGEMALYYACSDSGLLGGSFEPLGGQNLIEAAACGCPLVLGPHTFNFAEAAELAVQARAAMRAADIRQGVVYAAMLAVDPQRNGWVDRALTFASRHRGATERMAERIVGLLPAVI
ncbi:3-deoxy-D-manno-octulosonic acid transferase [Azohydromonas lata]|uniref:3-deoxy-D-manno-octulosonic acid transferase n=1 Tax=Azohydromonas lata TaxID=45677 RepID=A0ABU5IJJ0_9BURK|nr:3-deoxy-D-manno-octulosonic acid transferase [Azohydromonas lata]MDZ5459049.1 3-deoxy-D-manno-octulosonic acid transferase [Azohydromonas lata]